MERETKEFTTPAGTKVVVKTYLTARESNQLRQALYAEIKMSMSDMETGKTEVKDIPATALLEQERKALEILIVNIDDSADNIADRLLDLRSEEYDAIVAEVNKITKPNFQGAK
jgi:hypothetical protein